MKRNEYIAQPTAAAIDTAMARALSFESDQPGSAPEAATASLTNKARTLLGQSGSFERGFVQTAGLIVLGLLLGRVFTPSAALLGTVVPLAVLAALTTHKVIRGIAPVKPWLAQRRRQIALGIACSPALTRFAPGSFSRSERASLWTAWGASLIGLAALAAG